MRVLFIGGTSFFGLDAVEAFRDRGDEVTIITRGHSGIIPHGVTHLALDRRDQAALKHALEGLSFDVCIDNIAYQPGDVEGLLAALGTRVGHFILTSSIVVYPGTTRLRAWKVPEGGLLDDFTPTVGQHHYILGKRAAERALRFRHSPPWTILRPPNVEGQRDPTDRTWWFVCRVLDGGPMILPSGDLPTYRHVYSRDLAQAFLTVAGRPEAFYQTANVVGLGVMTYWGQASLVMDGLGIRVPFEYLPQSEWREAGFGLPMGDAPGCLLWERSEWLHQLGWRPTPDELWLTELARYYAAHPRGFDTERREQERQQLARWKQRQEDSLRQIQSRVPLPLAGSGPGKGRSSELLELVGAHGDPASLRVRESVAPAATHQPQLKVQRALLSQAEQQILLGHLPSAGGLRVLGQHCLGLLGDPGESGLAAGWYHTFATRPCHDPTCEGCRASSFYVLGVHGDGFARSLVNADRAHLVPVPEGLEHVALLAGPLASLMGALLPALQEVPPGEVWIAGPGPESILAAWLAMDAGRSVVLLLEHRGEAERLQTLSPGATIADPESLLESVRQREHAAPSLICDLAPLGHRWSWQGILAPEGLVLAALGVAWGNNPCREVPGHVGERALLERALAQLQLWQAGRCPDSLLGPAVPPEQIWDLLLPPLYSLPYLMLAEERPCKSS